MLTVTRKGFYFIGKIKDLSSHLKILGRQYGTLQNLINKNLQ